MMFFTASSGVSKARRSGRVWNADLSSASVLVLQGLCWEEIWGIQTEPARAQSVSNPPLAAVLWKVLYRRDHSHGSV